MPKVLIGVYLDETTIAKADEEAEKLGLDRSPYLRMVIRNALFGDE